MANDAGNVALAVDGGIYIGDVGAAAPTSSSFSPTSNGYAHIGFYSQEGAQLTPVPGTETTIAAHDGTTVYDEQEPGWWTFQFGAIEFKRTVSAETFFDATIDATAGSLTLETAAVTTYRSLIAIAINKDGSQTLQHYPKVKISERQTINFNRTTLVTLGATFKTYKDDILDYQVKMFDPAWIDTPAKASISAVTPPAAAAGTLVKIAGVRFTGTTGVAGVKFGVTNATTFVVENDETIYAVMPAGSAGSAAVVVTNGVSASDAFPYTRGA